MGDTQSIKIPALLPPPSHPIFALRGLQNRASLRFVHDQLSADVAKKLGARSLREALLSTQCSMASQPCPNPQTLFTSLSPYIQVWG